MIFLKERTLKVMIIALLTITFSTVSAQAPYAYNVIKVAEDVYMLKTNIKRGRWVSSNISVIINDRDVVVVDSGLIPSAGREAIKEIKKLTSKPVRYLIITHWHNDHWQGDEAFVEAYPSIEIISTDGGYDGIVTEGYLALNGGYNDSFNQLISDRENALKTGLLPDGQKLTDERRKQIEQVLPETRLEIADIGKAKPIVPTLTFSEGMTFKRGNREIQLHFLGWGNTTGDAVIYLPKEKILITGDLIVLPSPYESGSFSKEWLDVYKKLRKFDYVSLVPGHGDIQKDYAYMDYLIQLFEEIISQVKTAQMQNKTLEEAEKVVTHETVTAALAKKPNLEAFIKELHPSFVAESVKRAFPKAKEGKL